MNLSLPKYCYFPIVLTLLSAVMNSGDDGNLSESSTYVEAYHNHNHNTEPLEPSNEISLLISEDDQEESNTAKGTSIAEILNPDGSLNLSKSKSGSIDVSGSIDISGYQMVTGADGSPRFVVEDEAMMMNGPDDQWEAFGGVVSSRAII